MKIQTLARKLVAETDEKSRVELCYGLNTEKSISLAKALKEICYEAWASNPKVAQSSARALKTISRIYTHGEIRAIAFWISGIAKITEGKLKAAIASLDKAHENFLRIKKIREAAQTQVSKLMALALLGRYDDAISIGKDAINKLKRFDDHLAIANIETNIANIFARRELHCEAIHYFTSARSHYIRMGNRTELTMCENGLAISYVALNDFRTAEKFFNSALARARRAKMIKTEAEIEASLGNLAMFRGRFDEALRLLENSRRKFAQLGMPHNEAVANLEIADIYLELNLIPEASELFARAVEILSVLKLQGEEARGRAHLARAQVESGDFSSASRENEKAIRLFAAEKNDIGIAEAELLAARMEYGRGKFEKALHILRDAKKRLRRGGNVRLGLHAQKMEAENLIATDKIVRARTLLSQTFNTAKTSHQEATAQEIRISLGRLEAREGNLHDAKSFFRGAIASIEKLRAPLPAEEFRIAFFAARLEPYIELARILLKEGSFEEAFLLIENARGRSLAESFGKTKLIASSNASRRLSREVSDLREELNWFCSRLDRAKRADFPNLESEIRRREKKVSELTRQISATAAKSKRSKNKVDLESIKNLIGREKILIEYVEFDGMISAFAITEKEIRYFENLTSEAEISALLEGLNFQFGALRYGLKEVEGFQSELRKRANSYLRELREKLLAPFESIVANRALMVVPVGQLNYVPFHALFDGEKYVVEKREVNLFPSAAVFQHISKRRRREITSTLFVANADERIPLVEDEIRNLQKLFKESTVMKGKSARVNDFLKVAGDYDLLHIACHGRFRADNPLFSSLHLNDGWVTVRDICAQKLKCEVVTLSACETGKNKIFGGEEILGLARGFLSAGARSLVLSLWTVNDKATKELMKDFYEALRAGANTSQALRIAQCNFIRRGEHPYFWSPFFVIGN